MDNFKLLGLVKPIVSALAKNGIIKPTPIQAKAIPPALEGKDILGSAQTGTGKTAAFCIPLIMNLIKSNRGSSLVMTPTRELATQISVELKKLLSDFPQLKTALLIGGEPMTRQLSQLRNRPRIIVGTPGRICDHLQRGSLMLHDANFLVLDETDRMLDMGFSDQLDSIVKFLPVKRQTLLFSATIPKSIEKVASKYLNNPERIAIDTKQLTVEKIRQDIVFTSESSKFDEFLSQLNNRDGSIIVFMRTKFSTEKMAIRLKKEGYKAAAINGDLRQHKRDRVLENFRNRRSRILVATDVAARGLDIPHIEHVINYDLPECPEDYVHRIGRTGRAGAEGSALCFVTPSEKGKWNAIDLLLNPHKKRIEKQKKYSKNIKRFSSKKTKVFKANKTKNNSFSNVEKNTGIKTKRSESKKTLKNKNPRRKTIKSFKEFKAKKKVAVLFEAKSNTNKKLASANA